MLAVCCLCALHCSGSVPYSPLESTTLPFLVVLLQNDQSWSHDMQTHLAVLALPHKVRLAATSLLLVHFLQEEKFVSEIIPTTALGEWEDFGLVIVHDGSESPSWGALRGRKCIGL